MYGSIAHYRVKPDKLDDLLAWGEAAERDDPGSGAMIVYQMDRDPNELFIAIVAESEAAYRATSESPEMHERYLQMLDYLASEPEWNDGHIIASEFNLPDGGGLYGTISRQWIKPGKFNELSAWNEANPGPQDAPGAMLVYQMDRDPNEVFVVIVAESEAAYRAMSESPDMYERYLEMVEYLDGEPEWHDGHVLAARVSL